MRERGKRARLSGGLRWFCGACGTHLYLTDEDYPDGVWPNAGAIDTPLPTPPQWVFLMTRDKPAWVPWPPGRAAKYAQYPPLSIAEWHARHIRRR
jgi:hypothetical protein